MIRTTITSLRVEVVRGKAVVFHRIGSTEIYSFFFCKHPLSTSPPGPSLITSPLLSPHVFSFLLIITRMCIHPPFSFLFTHQYTLFQYERISCTHINIYTQHIYLSELRNLSSFFFFPA